MRKKVLQLAKKLNASVVVNRERPLDISVEAPIGYYWLVDPCVHGLVRLQMPDEPADHVWLDLHERMKMGIEKCPCEDCRE